MKIVTLYTDYKSHYAYLAKDLAYELARQFPIVLDVLPYTLDIPKFLGSAELDEDGKLKSEERNDHQWRRVRYSYIDARRQARKRGLTILGPRKIWDSSLAAIGLLFAKRQGEVVMRAYHDRVFERFWRRDANMTRYRRRRTRKVSSACRVSSSTASFSGAASSFRIFVRCCGPTNGSVITNPAPKYVTCEASRSIANIGSLKERAHLWWPTLQSAHV